MWIRKSPETIAAEMAERAKSPRLLPALAIAAAATAGVGVFFALGIRGFSRGVFYLESAESSREQLARKPWILVIVFAFIFWWVYRRPKGSAALLEPNRTLLCTRCFEPSSPHESQCSCGGELEPIVLWEWVEDEEQAGEARQ